ncbi:MAG: DUF2029 domain-containing protein [Chloroflexi bacterium]|nr:MAG: DUF2029 domain-containing protein [Chloroflexota bacterium]
MRMHRSLSERGQRLAKVVALIGVGLAALHNLIGWITFAINRPFEGDFAAYYAFTRIGLHAGFGHLYEVAAQRQEWQALGPLLWYPAVYPPPLAFVVAPLAVLPFPVAYAIWNLLLGIAVLVTWRLLAPGSRWQRSMQLGIAFALPLVAFSLLLGQVVMLLGATLALCWWCLRRGSPVFAGIILSLIAVKPQLAFLVPLGLVAGLQFRAAIGWASASAALAVVTLAAVGTDGIAAYVSRLQDATGGLAAYQVPVGLTLPGLVGHGVAALAAQTAVLIGITLAAFVGRARGPQWSIALGVIGSLLITPFYHPDDLAILVPAAWLWMHTAPALRERIVMAAGLGGALLIGTPLPLILCLLAALLPVVDRVSARRVSLPEAA